MTVSGIDKRAMIRDRTQALTGLSKRITLLTSTSSEPDMTDVDPFSRRPTSAPTKYIIRGVFFESRSALDTEDPVGNVRARKGYIEFHPMFLPRVRAAQMLIVAGEAGRWRIVGTPDVFSDLIGKAFIQSAD